MNTNSASSWDDTAAEECTDNHARPKMRKISSAKYLARLILLFLKKNQFPGIPLIASCTDIIIT